MYVRKDKVILVDVDGCLLDWEYAFAAWADRHGYKLKNESAFKIEDRYGISQEEGDKLVNMFNESAWISQLSPVRDSIKYVRKLHEEHGFVFHVISSLSDDYFAQNLRTKNLFALFGKSVFERFVYLKTLGSKDEILKEYEGTECYWVEDMPKNARAGYNVGLTPLLISHHHNADDIGDGSYTRVNNWKEIYDIIMFYS